MRSVRRSTLHDALVHRLAEDRHPATGQPIFKTIRELQCFAAMVGYQFGRRCSLTGDTREIPARVFESEQGALDLLPHLALVEIRDLDVLREDRANEAVDIFEEYAEGGFRLLAEWLAELPSDSHGDAAIFAGMAKAGLLG